MTKTNYERAVENRRVASAFPLNTSRAMTPAEAQARIARLIANPIPAVNGSTSVDTDLGIFGGLKSHNVPGKPGYHVEDPRIADQSAKPNNPGIRTATASTYGKVIPISFGVRRLEGNVIQSSDMVPRLVGNKTKYIEYQIPIYEDPPVDPKTGFQLDTGGASSSGSTSCGGEDACDTRTGGSGGSGGGGGGDGGGDGGGGGGGPGGGYSPSTPYFGVAYCGVHDHGDITCSDANYAIANDLAHTPGWFSSVEDARLYANSKGWTTAGGGDGTCGYLVNHFADGCDGPGTPEADLT